MNSALKKTLVAMATAALGLTGGCAGDPAAAEGEGSEGGDATEHSCGAGSCGGEESSCGGEEAATDEAASEEASCGGEEGGEEASCGGEEG